MQRLLGYLRGTQEMLAAEARQQLQLYAATLSLPEEGLAGRDVWQSSLPAQPFAAGDAAPVPLPVTTAAEKVDAAVGCREADFVGGVGGRKGSMELGNKKGAIELVQLVMDERWSPDGPTQLEMGWEMVRSEVASCLDVPVKCVQLGATGLLRGRHVGILALGPASQLAETSAQCVSLVLRWVVEYLTL